MVDTIAAIVFWAWVIFVLVAGVGIFIGEGLEGVRIRRHHVGKGARARIKSWWEETLTDFNDASERRFPVMVFGLFAIPVLGFEAKSSFSFNPFVTLMLLLCCLGIAFLIKEILSLDRKLLSARRVLLDVTFHECHCNPDAKTVPFNHGDAIREARVFLEEQFPGAIEQEIHGYEWGRTWGGIGTPQYELRDFIAEDLWDWLEAHQAKPQ